jgi:inorganic pyrophosphatase
LFLIHGTTFGAGRSSCCVASAPGGKAERNDRLFAVPRRSHSEQGLRDVRDLSRPIQQELEKFFIATDELENKRLEIIGWKGPKIAMKAIKDSAKGFSKNGK